MSGLGFGHPLLCPPVLQRIFNNLELEELKICRLVCQSWNPISLFEMKNNFRTPGVRISLTDEDRLERFLKNETGFSGFQQFKLIFSVKSEPPLRKFVNQFKGQIQDITFVVGNTVIDKLLSFLAENCLNWKNFGLEINGDSSWDWESPYSTDGVNWSKLKSLSILKNREFPIFVPILEKASNLEKLVINEGPALYSTYHPILEKLIDTLIEFELDGFRVREAGNGPPLKMTSFSKLKRLKIGGMEGNHTLTISALPELCELSLNWFKSQHLPIYPKLTFMNLDAVREEYFKKIQDSFPNLKKLRIKCESDDQVKLVLRYFNKIEELSIDCPNVSDGGISGIFGDVDFVKWQQGHDPKRKSIDWSNIYLLEKEPHHPYRGIRDLSELKRITIATPHISNVSIIFGILKCKSLRSVHLLCPSPYLTKDILRWMADDLTLSNLTIGVSTANLDWELSEEAIYFQKKHPLCQLTFPYYPNLFSVSLARQKL